MSRNHATVGVLIFISLAASPHAAGAQVGNDGAAGSSINGAKQANVDRPMERYEGHLIAGDVGFNLRIYHEGKASADWSRSAGQTLRYTGTYTGEEGNYVTKLTLQPSSSGPTPLTLTVRSLGGMVTGQYVAAGTAPRSAQELRLMEVEAGDVKLHGSRRSASGSRRSTTGQRTTKRHAPGRLNSAQRRALRQLGHSRNRP